MYLTSARAASRVRINQGGRPNLTRAPSNSRGHTYYWRGVGGTLHFDAAAPCRVAPGLHLNLTTDIARLLILSIFVEKPA